MSENIVFLFVDDYPDWESAEALYFITVLGESTYKVKAAGLTKKPIRSVSDVCIIPDYDIEEIIGKFAGLILVGGIGWSDHMDERIKAIQPLIDDAVSRRCPIGGVGTGADIMGAFGLLNNTIHTGNSSSEMYLVSDLGQAPEPYSGESLFREAGAIRNGNLVTARNISGLAFARAFMWTLNVDQNKADIMYEEHKNGAVMPMLDADEDFTEIVI